MDRSYPLPSYLCKRVRAPQPINGDLDKRVWQQAVAVTLTDVTGETTRTQRTTLHVCTTDSNLYVAFLCEDNDIWGTLTERDTPLYEEEVVEVFLSPTGDVHHYYEFEVSPLNAIFDAKVYSPDLHRRTMQVDTSWNCPGLQTAVKVHGTIYHEPPNAKRLTPNASPGWWSVEIAIPFAAFPEVSPPKPGETWRANFYRIDRAAPTEFTAWSSTLEDPPNFHVPERFGYLVFE